MRKTTASLLAMILLAIGAPVANSAKKVCTNSQLLKIYRLAVDFNDNRAFINKFNLIVNRSVDGLAKSFSDADNTAEQGWSKNYDTSVDEIKNLMIIEAQILNSLKKTFTCAGYGTSIDSQYGFISIVKNSKVKKWPVSIAMKAKPVKPVCNIGGSCPLGSVGPGGGVVFYDAGTQQSWGRYLEVAPAGWSGKSVDPNERWCNVSDVFFTGLVLDQTLRGALGVEIGKGKANTNLMVRNCSWGAGVVAQSYRGGGKSDWYLPSRSELNELCKYAQSKPTGKSNEECGQSENLRGGFYLREYYWSSSEWDAINVPIQTLSSGGSGYADKRTQFAHVRPIRAF
jgi:hypothetical protein